MNTHAASSALRRRDEILRVLRDGAVRSQEELQQRLARRGIDVAQPTLSRDLKDLGFAKTASGYVVLGEESAAADPGREAHLRERLERTLREWVLDVASAGTLVVLKTPPATANTVARAIDEAGLEGMAGSVAGDDTIFLATPSPAAAAKLARLLETSLAGRRPRRPRP
ncbi:MAG TPA: hypothetical protein VMN04_14795 [Thermoanaerobaculia bacterium]|nr:hypothetical protein [Thermoanaerobaculia bacterium]